jgi:hypothetical protein
VATPEPSPLFWEHFSARVRSAIDDQPADATRLGWWRWPSWALGSLAAAAAVAALTVVGPSRTQPPAPIPEAEREVAAMSEAGPRALSGEEPVGEDWSVVREMAAELDYDDVTRLGDAVRPGAADAGVAQLSVDERRELVRLLQEELRRAQQS